MTMTTTLKNHRHPREATLAHLTQPLLAISPTPQHKVLSLRRLQVVLACMEVITLIHLTKAHLHHQDSIVSVMVQLICGIEMIDIKKD